jgi:hypothetical protein
VIGGVATVLGIVSLVVALIAISTTVTAISESNELLPGQEYAEPDSSGSDGSEAGGDSAAYCAAYSEAAPALDYLISMDPPDGVPTSGPVDEYVAALSAAVDDSIPAIKSLQPVTTDDTEYAVQSFLTAAADAQTYLAGDVRTGDATAWNAVSFLDDNARTLASVSTNECS